MIGGALLEGAVLTLVSILTFRHTIGVSVFMWFDRMIATFGNYPFPILPLAARAVLTYLLPVAFVAYLPAAVLTGRVASTGRSRLARLRLASGGAAVVHRGQVRLAPRAAPLRVGRRLARALARNRTPGTASQKVSAPVTPARRTGSGTLRCHVTTADSSSPPRSPPRC